MPAEQPSSGVVVEACPGGVPAARSARLSARLGLLFGGLVAGLLVGELAVRVTEKITGTSHALDFTAHMESGRRLFQPHPYIGYVLQPGAKSPDQLMESYSINSLGFRGAEFDSAKPPRTFRVACLGGSTTFGVGASDDEHTWPAILQTLLQGALPPGSPYDRVEVINAGVAGYTIIESFANLKLRVLPLQPDLVVDYDGINDSRVLGLSTFRPDYSHVRRIWSLPAPSRMDLLLDWSHLYGLLRGPDAIPDLNDVIEASGIVESSDEVPGLATWRRTLTEIIALGRVSGCDVALTSCAWTTERPVRKALVAQQETDNRVLAKLNAAAQDVAARQGALFIDLENAVGKAKEFFVDPVHLTDAGNDRLARAVAQAIVARGLLREPVPQRPVLPVEDR